MTLRSVSKRALLALALSIPGCVVYDNNCDLDEKEPGAEDSGLVDDVDQGEAEAPLLLVDPDTVEPGETLIAALVLDPESPTPLEFQSIVEVRFSGGISVCSEQARQGELLLSLVVDEDAAPGSVDLMVILDDGERFVVPDAVEIVDPGLVGGDAGEDAGDGGDDAGGGFVEDEEPVEDEPIADDPCR